MIYDGHDMTLAQLKTDRRMDVFYMDIVIYRYTPTPIYTKS